MIRLYPEIAWVNNFRLADPGLAVERPPVLLAPMAAILGSRVGRMAMSAQLMRGILDSIATRLDEARDLARYMTGLLVFLGLLGTFWGLIETVGSVGGVIQGLKTGGDAGSMFDSLRDGLAAPLSGMGISFSSSLFGLAGSLVLGFLDLQSSQAQNRFYTELEDWLSTTVYDQAAEPIVAAGGTTEMRSAIDRLREALSEGGTSKGASSAMSNLAEAIQGLVHHMRTEQQMIRDWADSQAEQQREIKRLLESHGARESRPLSESDGKIWPSARTRRGESGMNYWPGFVDALSTLILTIIFILTVFVVVQFYLQQEVAGKDTALSRLNAQIAQLTELLSMEKTGKANLEDQLAQLRASLASAASDRDKYKGLAEGSGAGARRGAGQGRRTQRPARRREEDFLARAGAGRNPQPADRGVAPPARRDRDWRSMPPRRRTRRRRARSPISASGSIWRWRRRCRS